MEASEVTHHAEVARISGQPNAGGLPRLVDGGFFPIRLGLGRVVDRLHDDGGVKPLFWRNRFAVSLVCEQRGNDHALTRLLW